MELNAERAADHADERWKAIAEYSLSDGSWYIETSWGVGACLWWHDRFRKAFDSVAECKAWIEEKEEELRLNALLNGNENIT